MKVIHIIVFASIVMSFNTCMLFNYKQKVSGIYYARHGKGVESIKLNKDGEYIHDYKNGNTHLSQNGKWHMEFPYDRILFDDYITYVNPYESADPSQNKAGFNSSIYKDNTIIVYVDLADYNFYKSDSDIDK